MANKNRLFMIVLTLCLIGVMMVYSASSVVAKEDFGDEFYYFKRQLLFCVVGLFLMKFVSRIDYHIYQKHVYKILLFAFVLLGLVLIPGIGQVRGGSRSWFSLGSLSFQPSEFFKVAIIMYLASYFSKHYDKSKKLRTMLLPMFFLVLGFLIIMCQPDFGSGFVMMGAGIILLFVTAFPLYYFAYLAIIAIIGAGALIVMAPYRLTRLLSFLDPFSDPLGSGFQAIQSMYAIGPGGVLGVGFNQSFQKHFYLPEPQTDFIFAIFAEEFGLVGSVFLVILFFLFFCVGIQIALKSDDLFGFYLALGIVSLLGFQTIVNLCVVTGLFPVTGETCNLEMLVSTSYLGAFRGEFVSFLLFFYPIGCILRRFS